MRTKEVGALMNPSQAGELPPQLDAHDWQLLHLLADVAGVDLQRLAELSGLRETDMGTRIRALKESGVIIGIHAKVDAVLLGVPVTSFFLIRVARQCGAL